MPNEEHNTPIVPRKYYIYCSDPAEVSTVLVQQATCFLPNESSDSYDNVSIPLRIPPPPTPPIAPPLRTNSSEALRATQSTTNHVCQIWSRFLSLPCSEQDLTGPGTGATASGSVPKAEAAPGTQPRSFSLRCEQTALF